MTELQITRMKYLGVLNLLAESSILFREGYEAEEMRESIEMAIEDAQSIIPELRYKRVLSRMEIDLQGNNN